jgi:VanZ family protein
MDRRTLGYWVRVWLPVAISVAVICAESTEAFGSNHTSGPLRWLYEHLIGRVSNGAWDVIHHLIRKTGHVVGYGLVALTWLRAWWMTLPNSGFIEDAGLALCGTAMMAIGDEFHQSFLPNRTSSPWDVMLDCTGAILMQLLVFLFLRLFRPARLARAS